MEKIIHKPVSFVTACRAKKLKFIESVEYYYHSSNPDLLQINELGGNSTRTYFIGAPSQDILKTWLRIKHNIIVEVMFDSISYGHKVFNPYLSTSQWTPTKFKSWNYEEALEEGLRLGLLIKETKGNPY